MAEADVLFRSIKAGEESAHSWETNAWVSGASDYAYAEGYRRAARLVADHVIQSKWDIDFLVYPVAFLYRHNVELQLKRLIPDGAFLADVPLSEKDRELLPSTHRLDLLWILFKPILGKIAGEFGVTDNDMKAIESYVNQIHRIDDRSFAFRYMNTKSGDRSIDGGELPHINVGALASAMEKLTATLFGLGEAFHEAVQVECEMRAEAYADYQQAYSDGS